MVRTTAGLWTCALLFGGCAGSLPDEYDDEYGVSPSPVTSGTSNPLDEAIGSDAGAGFVPPEKPQTDLLPDDATEAPLPDVTPDPVVPDDPIDTPDPVDPVDPPDTTDPVVEPPPGMPQFSIDNLYSMVFYRCSPCHTKYIMDEGLHSRLLETANPPGLSYIEPFDPNGSYLWHKMTGTQADVGGGGGTMPFGQPLTQDQIDYFRLWIEAGAPK